MIVILFIFNIALALVLICWPIFISKKYLNLPFINPLTIHVAINFPVEIMKLIIGPIFLLEKGIFDVGYQYAVAASNFFTAFQVFGFVWFINFFSKYKFEKILPFQNFILAPTKLRYCSIIFFFLYGLFFFLLTSGEFGFFNWIINPREGYQLHRTGNGHWFALCVSALSISYFLRCLSKRNSDGIIQISIIYLFFSYFLGSKGVMLWYFESTLVILWFTGYKKLKFIATIGLPLVFLLLIFNLYLALGNNFEIASVMEYFDYFANGAVYYNSYINDEIKLFYGEVFAGSFWDYIPRALWNDKPVVYGITIINEYFYPGQAELTNTPAFGGAVTQFADFGWFGLLIFGFFSRDSFFFAISTFWIYRSPKAQWNKISAATAILMITNYAPGFGAFFPLGLQVILTLFLFILIYFTKKSKATNSRLLYIT